jgi:hypothetical protein
MRILPNCQHKRLIVSHLMPFCQSIRAILAISGNGPPFAMITVEPATMTGDRKIVKHKK